MKKFAVGAAFALALIAVPAHASNPQSDGRWGNARVRSNVSIVQPAALPGDPTAVPEPSSVWMLGSALIALAGVGLIRRGSTSAS